MKKITMITSGIISASIILGCATVYAFNSQGISEEKAKTIALSHASVQEEDVTSMTIQKETENNLAVYSVEFSTTSMEYDYDILRSNGEIIKSQYEAINQSSSDTTTSSGSSSSSNANSDTSSSTSNTNNDTSSGTSSSSSNNTNSSSSSTITKEEAKSIALAHAGVSASDTKMLRVTSDYDDGIAIYDVEFYAGNTEYDYEIAQSDGRIISYDYDIEGYSASSNSSSNSSSSSSSSSSNIISVEKAKSLALAKVSGATSQHIHISLDYDDGKSVYEGEIHYGNMEYEFEIDATTGSFLEWSSDYND